jgi:hypothetical protein
MYVYIIHIYFYGFDIISISRTKKFSSSGNCFQYKSGIESPGGVDMSLCDKEPFYYSGQGRSLRK